MVRGLSDRISVPVPDLVQAFGEHPFGRFVASHPAFFTGVTGALDFPERIEDVIHVEVLKLYPDAALPRFDVTRTPDRLMLVYRSIRHFEDLAHGLIFGCLAHYGERAQVSREPIVDSIGAAVGTLAKSRFLATTSHEIRTPLNAVIGLIELLSGMPLADDQHAHLHTLHQSADTLLAIVDDILDFSGIEAGRVDLEQRDVDPLQLARDTQTLLRPQAEAKALGLALTLRAGPPPRRAVGDPTHLRQARINLLSNAIKSTAHGEVAMALHTEPLADGGWCRQGEVRDTGIGTTWC